MFLINEKLVLTSNMTEAVTDCTARHNHGCRNLIKTVSGRTQYMQYSNSFTKLGAVTSKGEERHLLSTCQAMKRKPFRC
jgi:hypothetical protein